MPLKAKTCTKCGGEVTRGQYEYGAMCDECRDQLLYGMHQLRPARDWPEDWSFEDVADKAEEMKMSYGRLRALVYEGLIDPRDLEKPKRPTRRRRRRL